MGIFDDELVNVLATIVSGCSDHLLLCGDVNCTSATDPGLDERLSTTLMEFRLTQHVTQPTRGDRHLAVLVTDEAILVGNVLDLACHHQQIRWPSRSDQVCSSGL